MNSGASFAVVTGIALFGFTSPYQYVWFGFLGAALAGVVVFGWPASAGAPATR